MAHSEDEFQRKLNIAVLDPAVLNRGSIPGNVLTKTADRGNNWSSGERAHVEIAIDDIKIRVVKQVVDFGTELKLQLFRYREILVYTCIESPHAGSVERITSSHRGRKRTEVRYTSYRIDIAAVRRPRREIEIVEFVRILCCIVRVFRIK